jgi:hypothetical protein
MLSRVRCGLISFSTPDLLRGCHPMFWIDEQCFIAHANLSIFFDGMGGHFWPAGVWWPPSELPTPLASEVSAYKSR